MMIDSNFMTEYSIVNLKTLLEPILHVAGQNVIRAKDFPWMSVWHMDHCQKGVVLKYV